MENTLIVANFCKKKMYFIKYNYYLLLQTKFKELDFKFKVLNNVWSNKLHK